MTVETTHSVSFSTADHVINSIADRRYWTNEINDYDDRNGVLRSQRAKYEKPTWWYIACILPGFNKRGLSTTEIQNILAAFNIFITYQSISRILRIMSDTKFQIHPHRRGCGISCHDVVTELGGLDGGCYEGDNREMFYNFKVNDNAVRYFLRERQMSLS
jgi:hypothetical protein